MKLTPAELEFLGLLDRVVGNAMPMEWLKPAKRAMARRMRRKGLLSRRHPYWAKWTELGKLALAKSRRPPSNSEAK